MDEVNDSCVHGYYIYKDLWNATPGETLTCTRERGNRNNEKTFYYQLMCMKCWQLYVHEACTYYLQNSGRFHPLKISVYTVYICMYIHTYTYFLVCTYVHTYACNV